MGFGRVLPDRGCDQVGSRGSRVILNLSSTLRNEIDYGTTHFYRET